MEGFEHLASASIDDVLSVARDPGEQLPPDLGVVARVRQGMALSKLCAARLAAFPIQELIAAVDRSGAETHCWEAVADALAERAGALEELRGLLEGDADSGRAALHALYALACADAGWRDGKWKRQEVKPPIPALLLELRGHKALKELAKEDSVQKGRVDFVCKAYKRRHG
jgi:hypothetical protein